MKDIWNSLARFSFPGRASILFQYVAMVGFFFFFFFFFEASNIMDVGHELVVGGKNNLLEFFFCLLLPLNLCT